jgi:hypothetical protein
MAGLFSLRALAGYALNEIRIDITHRATPFEGRKQKGASI